jgi:two-component system chemotaxis response regulator CheB
MPTLPPELPPAIRVLVVDDSVVVRRLVTKALTGDPAIDVVGTASSGRLALERVRQLTPDVVTLDIEMPDMDGLETLRRLRAEHPRLPVVMFSSLTERGAAATLDALALGANDYVTKPTLVGSHAGAMATVRDQLVPRIKALCAARTPALPQLLVRPTRPEVERPEPTQPVDVVAIGASTGGPDALMTVLQALPADFRLPILVVQHMPALFTRLFARRLDANCAISVREARDGDPIEPGTALVAPGDFHLAVASEGGRPRAVVHQQGPENWVRPAVDVLFRSVAEVYRARALAVVLTGMGQDGIRGCEQLRDAGAQVVAQDEATSVVWGMPGGVAKAGLAGTVLPIGAVAGHLADVAARGTGVPTTLMARAGS